MNKVTIFVIIALIQLAVPLHMIIDKEITLQTGKEFKFKTEPVDPYDAYRGKYVHLNFEASELSFYREEWDRSGVSLYAIIEEVDGFAKIIDLQKKRPSSEVDYFSVTTRNSFSGTMRVDLPFDRYYMDETKAPVAEKEYNRYMRQSDKQDAYVVVSVKNGKATLKELYVDGMTIGDFLQTVND